MIVADEEGNIKLAPVPFIQVLGGEAYIPDSMEEIKMLKDLMSLERIKEIKKLIKKRKSTKFSSRIEKIC